MEWGVTLSWNNHLRPTYDKVFGQQRKVEHADWVAENNPSVDEFHEYLVLQGFPGGRSAAGVALQRMQADLAVARADAYLEAVTAHRGERDESTQGRALNQLLRTILSGAMMNQLQDPGAPPNPKEAAMMARAVNQQARAQKANLETAQMERKIREDQARKDAEAVQQEARKRGASPEFIEAIRDVLMPQPETD